MDMLNCLQDLWQSHQCLQHVEGFDHSVVNSTLGACGGLPPGQENPTLPFSVWQCGESKVVHIIFEEEECYKLDYLMQQSLNLMLIQLRFKIAENERHSYYHGIQFPENNKPMFWKS